MWLLILIVIAILIFASNKKKKSVQVKHSANAPSRKTPQKYKDMIRSERNLDRLTPDGELPIGWLVVYEDFIEQANNDVKYFYSEYSKHQYGEPKKKYAALKSLLQYFKDAKKIYAQKGECFLYWFETMWARPEDIESLNDELKYLEDHLQELEEQYKKRQYVENILIPDIKEKAIKIIKNNQGILQTDVYGYFDSEVKTHVQTALNQLNKAGKIRREKQGRTYKLSIQK